MLVLKEYYILEEAAIENMKECGYEPANMKEFGYEPAYEGERGVSND